MSSVNATAPFPQLPQERNVVVMAMAGVVAAVLVVVVMAAVVVWFSPWQPAPLKSAQVVARKETTSFLKRERKFSSEKEEHLYQKLQQAVKPSERETYAEELVKVNPSADNYVLLGSINVEQGELEQARTAFEKALEKDAQHVPTLAYYGYVLASQDLFNQPAKGKAMLEQAVATDKSNPVGHYYLGLILADQGEYRQAREEIELAAVLDPENTQVAQSREAIRQIVIDQDPSTLASLPTWANRAGHAGQPCHDAQVVDKQPTASGQFTYTEPSGKQVAAVCLHLVGKQGLLPIDQHQVRVGNGKEFCYQVEGVGTSSVSITKKAGGFCPALEHVDLYVE